MNWLYKLQRKFRRFSIDNLMIYVTATMLAVYLMDLFFHIGLANMLSFNRSLIFRGEIWRLITFIFIPPGGGTVFLLIALYFYYFIGNSLEREWGASQFTFYYLCGVVGTIIAGLLTGRSDNSYLNLSLFFAFAQLYPDHQLLLFFILPVKMKYLAYLNWALFGISFLGALVDLNWAVCLAILASLLNFFLFFGPDFWNRFQNKMRYGKQRRNFRKQTKNNDNNFWR